MKLLAALTLFALTGCQPSLNSQPRFSQLAESPFFPDGAAARPVPAGTRTFAAGARVRELTPLARLEHGRALYAIHCVACHGLTGEGGLATIRGFGPTPSLISPKALAMSAERVAAIVRNGEGGMYGFANRLDGNEIASIAVFLRALQLSQHAPASELPSPDRQALAAVQP